MLSASFAGCVPQANKPWTQFRDATVLGLTAEGFRVDEKKPSFFSVTRLIAGISASRALKQAGVFDELLDSGAAVIR